MTLYEKFQTETARNENVEILYSVAPSDSPPSNNSTLADDIGVQIETVFSLDEDELIVPFGEEPEQYMEKLRFYEEAEQDFRLKFNTGNL